MCLYFSIEQPSICFSVFLEETNASVHINRTEIRSTVRNNNLCYSWCVVLRGFQRLRSHFFKLVVGIQNIDQSFSLSNDKFVSLRCKYHCSWFISFNILVVMELEFLSHIIPQKNEAFVSTDGQQRLSGMNGKARNCRFYSIHDQIVQLLLWVNLFEISRVKH